MPKGARMIWRLIKLIFWLTLLGAIALVIFSYLGPILMPASFQPPVQEIREPVQLNIGQPGQ